MTRTAEPLELAGSLPPAEELTLEEVLQYQRETPLFNALLADYDAERIEEITSGWPVPDVLDTDAEPTCVASVDVPQAAVASAVEPVEVPTNGEPVPEPPHSGERASAEDEIASHPTPSTTGH